MKTTTIQSLGLNLNISVPESVEEFDQNAKKAGACLNEAINNILYRGVLADFRSLFCEKVEEAYGVERQTKDTGRTKKVKDANGKETEESIFVYSESEAKFIDRVIASKGLTREALQPLADAVLSAKDENGNLIIAFDASATEKKVSGPKKLAQKYTDAAKTLLADGKAEAFNKKLEKAGIVAFTATEDAEKNVIDLGWKVKAFIEWTEAQAISKLVA